LHSVTHDTISVASIVVISVNDDAKIAELRAHPLNVTVACS